MELSNVLLFWKQWREAPGTRSPNFSISSAEMPITVFVISMKLWLLCVWKFSLRYPCISLIQHHRFHQNWFPQLGLMVMFPRWPVTILFRTTKLYRLPRVTGSFSEFETWTTEIKFHTISGKYSEISSGPMYLKIYQFFPGLLFRDEFGKMLEPYLGGIISPRI